MPNRKKRKEFVLFIHSLIVFTTTVSMLTPVITYSQLNLTNVGANYTTLATSLTKDPNVIINNATGRRRNSKQMAFFSNPGGNNLQVNSGIVLTTGDVEDSNNDYNYYNGYSGDHSYWPMDPADEELLSVSFPGAEIYDFAILEFDLKITNGSGLQFNYVFASEEYPEYVCAIFDDAFGLWIKGGTEYPTYTNIARSPVGDLPISINYINNGVMGSEGSSCPTDWNKNSSFYINNYNGNDLEADGLTSRLTSNLILTPNVTYRFKIGISDISDEYLDSWVYIEANFAALPVNILSFEGNYQSDGYSRLIWNVANEKDFSHYMVQRSKDPVNGFEDVNSVKGAGASLYSFLDYSGAEDYYYRLKMVDLDGTTTFSDIVYVASQNNKEIIQIVELIEGIHLIHESPVEQSGILYIYNTSGQLIYHKEVVLNTGSNEIKLDALNLNNGVFLGSLITDNSILKTKIIK